VLSLGLSGESLHVVLLCYLVCVSEGKATSRNELMIISLRAQLTLLERAARDAEFRAMADDPSYQAEARQLLTEFAAADREAWTITAEKPVS